jgi:hypothetical protein
MGHELFQSSFARNETGVTMQHVAQFLRVTQKTRASGVMPRMISDRSICCLAGVVRSQMENQLPIQIVK